MRTAAITDIGLIASQFELNGTFISAQRYGRGHINETFLVQVDANREPIRYILQRINTLVFREPEKLLENIWRVTEHLNATADDGGICLALIPTRTGEYYFRDTDNSYWRVYRYAENTVSHDNVESADMARSAAAMFGRFQDLASSLPAPRLHETIADFHDTPHRFRQFHEALADDACGRARDCAPQIDFALSLEDSAGALVELQQNGSIPERITHNDTKLNNVLFDKDSDKAVCVIDLDTVMPGLSLYDFGDLVRTSTMTAAEDERDLSAVSMRLDYFAALVDGYLSTARNFLMQKETEHLALSGRILTIETGVRFLTDYLAGDRYFRTDRPGQNLDRCKTQFALVESIDEQYSEMQDIVAKAADFS